jgi:hypothetical protein
MNGPGFIAHHAYDVLLNQRACIDHIKFLSSTLLSLLNFITHLASPKPTPSKKAAAALAAVSLESPTKPFKALVKPIIDDERLPESPASLEADPELAPAPVETVASDEVEDTVSIKNSLARWTFLRARSHFSKNPDAASSCSL